MKTNQKGFSAVVVLLIVVIVGVIAGAGWFVWRSRSQKDYQSASTTTTSTKPIEQTTQKPKVETKQIPEGFAEYKNSKLGILFAYPKEWGEPADETINSDNPYFKFPKKSSRPDGFNEAFAGFSTTTPSYQKDGFCKSSGELNAVQGFTKFTKSGGKYLYHFCDDNGSKIKFNLIQAYGDNVILVTREIDFSGSVNVSEILVNPKKTNYNGLTLRVYNNTELETLKKVASSFEVTE